MYARPTPTRYELVDTLENTWCFTDRSSSHTYSGHQIHFKFKGCIVNRDSGRSVFCQVLIIPSKRLMIRLPPRWIYLSVQLNSNTYISIGKAVVEVDICHLGVRITMHVYRTLSMSEVKKLHGRPCELTYSATY
ncbi:hypothetical protein TNCV_4440961 [Trichonephila clavipes]|nr:hypothetical protein TNCV_4440961 [Trichonephila clavipes]